MRSPRAIVFYILGYNASFAANNTFPKIATIDSSGAAWEFTDDWDCHGNELEIIRNIIPWGKEGAIEGRRSCAKRCLEYSNCEAFNYPKEGNMCVLKYNARKSKIRGWHCGGVNTIWQYYTLLKKNGNF